MKVLSSKMNDGKPSCGAQAISVALSTLWWPSNLGTLSRGDLQGGTACKLLAASLLLLEQKARLW